MVQRGKMDDVDPVETQEWLESIDSILKVHGAERAHFLLERLIDHTRRSGAYLPYKPNTAYLNTIAVSNEKPYPGDRALERRIEAYIRWNAMAMVVNANRTNSEYGGHIATYASSATLYEVGFNHFWRAPGNGHPGRPGVRAGPLESRNLCARLPRGKAERGAAAAFPPGGVRQGPVFLSASLADARFLAVSDGVHGTRPDAGDLPGQVRALPGAPGSRAGLRPEGLVLPGRRRDGRTGVHGRADPAGTRKAGQPGLCHQLQPAAARRPGARQRQGHPGAGGGFPRAPAGT